jgi:hypothetical protein
LEVEEKLVIEEVKVFKVVLVEKDSEVAVEIWDSRDLAGI